MVATLPICVQTCRFDRPVRQRYYCQNVSRLVSVFIENCIIDQNLKVSLELYRLEKLFEWSIMNHMMNVEVHFVMIRRNPKRNFSMKLDGKTKNSEPSFPLSM